MIARTTSGGSAVDRPDQVEHVVSEVLRSAATLRFSNTVESSNSSSDGNDWAPGRARSSSAASTGRGRRADPLRRSESTDGVDQRGPPAPFGPIRPVMVCRFEPARRRGPRPPPVAHAVSASMSACSPTRARGRRGPWMRHRRARWCRAAPLPHLLDRRTSRPTRRPSPSL